MSPFFYTGAHLARSSLCKVHTCTRCAGNYNEVSMLPSGIGNLCNPRILGAYTYIDERNQLFVGKLCDETRLAEKFASRAVWILA